MTDPVVEPTPDKPLDPEVLRIQKRVTRMMLIAALTFGIGLVTVFGAIIYRVATFPDKSHAVEVISPVPAAAPTTPAPAVVPAGPTPPPPATAGSTPASPASAVAPTSPAVRKAMENAKAVLPARAWLVSVSIYENRIVLAYEHVNGTTMFVVDANTLEITGRLDLKPE